MTEVLDVPFHKITFRYFKLEPCCLQSLKDDPEMLQVFLFVLTEDDDVIQVSHGELVETFQDKIRA